MGLRAPSAKHWRAEASLVAISFVWGSTFVLVKSALAEVSTTLFLAIRFTVAGVVLAAIYRRKLLWGSMAHSRGSWRGGVVAGVFLFGGYLFQTLGLRLTTPSKSAFLTGLAIVLVPLLCALVYRVVPRVSEGTGVGVAAAGMALITLEGRDLSVNAGDLLTIVGAFFYAAHLVAVGHFARRDGFERVSVFQVATAAVLATALSGWAEPAYIHWSPTVLAALAVTGLFATAAAFTVMAWAQQHTSPTRTAVIFAMEPVFAWATSFVALGEILAIRSAAGAALILAGILTVELKPLDGRKHSL